MFDLSIYLLASVTFLFGAYLFLPSTWNKFKKFDLIIVYWVLFLLSGRLLELFFLTDLKLLYWSIFPLSENEQGIEYFQQLPWYFLYLGETFKLSYWVIARATISLILLGLIFRKKNHSYDYSIFKTVVVCFSLLVTPLILFQRDGIDVSSGIGIYGLSYIVISGLVLLLLLISKLYLKSTPSVSWPVSLVLVINVVFLLLDTNVPIYFVLGEILGGLIIILDDNLQDIVKYLSRNKIEVNKISRISIARNQFGEKNKRNWVNEINSRYKRGQ